MHDRRRLEQLHVLVDRLERQPASRHRDWMLAEVRSRAVDVESGVRPAPIRPLDSEDESAASPERAAPARRPRRATPPRSVGARTGAAAPRPRAADPAPSAEPDHRVDLLVDGARLCLDDDVPEGSEAERRRPSSPWAQGLRG